MKKKGEEEHDWAESERVRKLNYPMHVEITAITDQTQTDLWVGKDNGYRCLSKTEQKANYYEITDPSRYNFFSHLNFHDVAEGPEICRNAFYVAFGPLSADPLDGIFVYMCACDMERVKRNPLDGDEECARMCFGVYRTNAETKDLSEIIRELYCGDCGQPVTNCLYVYHCFERGEAYCADGAKAIPDNPQQRIKRIKEHAEQDDNKVHWVYNLGVDDEFETVDIASIHKRHVRQLFQRRMRVPNVPV